MKVHQPSHKRPQTTISDLDQYSTESPEFGGILITAQDKVFPLIKRGGIFDILTFSCLVGEKNWIDTWMNRGNIKSSTIDRTKNSSTYSESLTPLW